MLLTDFYYFVKGLANPI